MDDLQREIFGFLAYHRDLGDPITQYLRQRRVDRPFRPAGLAYPAPVLPVLPILTRQLDAEADYYDEANACPPLDTEAPYDAE